MFCPNTTIRCICLEWVTQTVSSFPYIVPIYNNGIKQGKREFVLLFGLWYLSNRLKLIYFFDFELYRSS